MPKGAKKSGPKGGHNSRQLSTKADFTVYDFAHAVPSTIPSKTGRMKKGAANAWSLEAKQICGKSVVSDVAWFDKDLSDFDSENEESVQSDDRQPPDKLSRAVVRKSSSLSRSKAEGFVYPLDVWFLIGEYVRPDEVSKFASICCGSHIVVHSAKFWIGLYKRFCHSYLDLPMSLKPCNMARIHGLRGRVVRALYHAYSPFQDRLRCSAPFENDPDCLEGARCVLMWYQKVKNLWHFYFKFQRAPRSPCPLSATTIASRKRDLLAEADISHNPDADSLLLQAVSPSFISLPQVIGDVLIKTFITVGHGMRAHKLKLVFSPEYVHASKSTLANGTAVVMDPVMNIHVLRWWDPKYPHRN